MDHVVYLDYKAKELNMFIAGKKSMIIRGAMGRKYPYGNVEMDDRLFFIENRGDGLVKATAVVSEVFNSPQLSREESLQLVEKHQAQLCLDSGLQKRFGGKRYIVLISVKDFEAIDNFSIDRSAFGNMDDWLPVGDIESVKK